MTDSKGRCRFVSFFVERLVSSVLKMVKFWCHCALWWDRWAASALLEFSENANFCVVAST